MAEQQTGMSATREERRVDTQGSHGRGASPLRALQRTVADVDRMFDKLAFGRRLGSPLWDQTRTEGWMPNVDVSQKNNELSIAVDLPGMKRDEISVEVTDEAVHIEGERRREREEDLNGVYRRERSYGTFHRVIPLPEGAITDEARASFRDGVLEITMPCPPVSTRSRRVEISEVSSQR